MNCRCGKKISEHNELTIECGIPTSAEGTQLVDGMTNWRSAWLRMAAAKPSIKKVTLSVGILDKNLKVVKRSFEGNDLIRGIPMHETLEDLYAFVSDEYFSPGLGKLKPHSYAGRPGIGKPVPESPTKLLRDVKEEQKDRHVAWNKLALYGQAAFGGKKGNSTKWISH